MQQEIWFQKYKILDLLGSGGTAKVYLAEHIKLKSYRAIKFISKNHPLYELQLNEAFVLKNLRHSCIPIIYDIEESEEGSYIVEQYLEGETLREFVKDKGALREDILINFGLQLCDLIQYLHNAPRPIIYIDLKPDNIIVSGMTLKLIDFGSAVFCDEITANQKYYGTVGYAAPELFRHKEIDERCDVYGIGMLLYYMATGSQAKDRENELYHIDRVDYCSLQLKRIINRCLKYNPIQRYASINKLSRQLSVIAKKRPFYKTTNTTVTIAVAGSQDRIGVTHFALRLCKFNESITGSCLYQEKNESGCSGSIKSRYQGVTIRGSIYELYGISIQPLTQVEEPDTSKISLVVQDLGRLCGHNLEIFRKADVRMLVLGAKDWELEHSEATLELVTEYKDIFYLFNFLDGSQFQQVIKGMRHYNIYRIPYEPNPFSKITGRNSKEFYRELMEAVYEITESGRKPMGKEKVWNETKANTMETIAE